MGSYGKLYLSYLNSSNSCQADSYLKIPIMLIDDIGNMKTINTRDYY